MDAQTTSTPLGKVLYHMEAGTECNFTGDYCGNVTLAVTTNQGYLCTTTSSSEPFTVGEDEYNWECTPAQTNGTAIFTLQASRDGGYTNGVSVLDLLMIQQHILGILPLSNPFFRVAGDASNSNGITVLDITLIRQVLLAYTQTFPAGSWRFIPKFYFSQNVDFCNAFHNNPFNLAATNPFLGQYDYLGYASGLVIVAVPEGFALPASWYDFYGIKVGDVTGNASDATLWSDPVQERTLVSTNLEIDPNLEPGTAVLSFKASAANALQAYQLGFKLDPAKYELEQLNGNPALQLEDFEYAVQADGTIRVIWTDPLQRTDWEDPETELFQLHLRLKDALPTDLDDLVQLEDERLPTAFFNTAEELEFVELDITVRKAAEDLKGPSLRVLPNPVVDKAQLQLELPGGGEAQLSVFDRLGRPVWNATRHLEAGTQTWELELGDALAAGLYFYEIQQNGDRLTGKFLKL